MGTSRRIFNYVREYIMLIIQRLFWLEWKIAVGEEDSDDGSL